MGFNTIGALWKLGTGQSVGSALSTGLGFEPVFGSSDYDLVGSVVDNSSVGTTINNALGNFGSDSAKIISDKLDDQNYNSNEAEKQRLFELYLSNTAYSRAINDLKRNGINPYAVLTGLSSASTPSGASASYGGTASAYLTANSSYRNSRLGASSGFFSGVANSAISALARLGYAAILKK